MLTFYAPQKIQDSMKDVKNYGKSLFNISMLLQFKTL